VTSLAAHWLRPQPLTLSSTQCDSLESLITAKLAFLRSLAGERPADVPFE
jgi:hypothetical protein